MTTPPHTARDDTAKEGTAGTRRRGSQQALAATDRSRLVAAEQQHAADGAARRS